MQKKTGFRCMILFMLSFILLFPMLAAAASDGVTYTISQFGVSLKIPSSFTCATRETKEQDTFYQSGVYDYSVATQLFHGDVYLCGFSSDSEILTVNISVEDGFDFNTADNETMSSVMQVVLDGLSEKGYENIEYGIYKGNNGRSMYIHSASDTVHILTYTAQHDSYAVHLNLSSNNDMTNEQKTMVRDMFESIQWADKTEIAGVEYYYEDAGMHFTIPQGWIYEFNYNETDSISMDIKPKDNNRLINIIFACDDVWDLNPVEARKSMGFNKRQDVDSVFEQAFMDLVKSQDSIEYRIETHAGIQFGIVTANQKTDNGLSYISTTAFTIYNGYYCLFDMFDYQDLYGEVFQSILDSVHFDL